MDKIWRACRRFTTVTLVTWVTIVAKTVTATTQVLWCGLGGGFWLNGRRPGHSHLGIGRGFGSVSAEARELLGGSSRRSVISVAPSTCSQRRDSSPFLASVFKLLLRLHSVFSALFSKLIIFYFLSVCLSVWSLPAHSRNNKHFFRHEKNYFREGTKQTNRQTWSKYKFRKKAENTLYEAF